MILNCSTLWCKSLLTHQLWMPSRADLNLLFIHSECCVVLSGCDTMCMKNTLTERCCLASDFLFLLCKNCNCPQFHITSRNCCTTMNLCQYLWEGSILSSFCLFSLLFTMDGKPVLSCEVLMVCIMTWRVLCVRYLYTVYVCIYHQEIQWEKSVIYQYCK